MVARIIEVTRRGRKGEDGDPGATALKAITTGGSSTVYTITSVPPETSYIDGHGLTIKAHATNGAAPTANLDTLGAKPIKKLSGGSVVAIAVGDMLINQFYVLHYSSSASAFILFSRKNDTIGVDVQAYSSDLDNVSGTNSGDQPTATTSAEGVVEKATTSEAQAGTEEDKFPDVVGVAAAIAALSPISAKSYASSAQTITSSSMLTLAHGLGVDPEAKEFWLECITTDETWEVGDKITPGVNNSSSATSRMNMFSHDTTNIYFSFTNSAQCFAGAPEGGGGLNGLDNAKWKLHVRAWA